MVHQVVKSPPKGAKLPPPTKSGAAKLGNNAPEPKASVKVGLPTSKPAPKQEIPQRWPKIALSFKAEGQYTPR